MVSSRSKDSKGSGRSSRREDGKIRSHLASKQKDIEQPPNREFTTSEALFAAAVYLSLVAFSAYSVHRVPKPQPLDASVQIFSEGRAMAHARALAEDIGLRQVSQPGVEEGALYILQQLEELHYLPYVRDDLILEVRRESVTGAVNFDFIGKNITNAYQNITNVLARVSPKEPATRGAFLVNAHFDSTIGTAGASDCASCVGVGIEALRTILASPNVTLHGPVVFLFNGGEETLMQAAHGFMQQSPWASDLEAFINVESTGPYGLPIMFQHTGAWAAATYAKSAKHAHGTALSQDFFESGLIPADTDFKMFSSKHQGRLPGVDVAFVLGGSTYHTDRDVVDRIRPGTLQELGDSVVTTVEGFSAEIARRANGTSTESDEPSAYYFDIPFGMVAYPKSLGTMMHNAPLLMLALFPGHAGALLNSAKPPGSGSGFCVTYSSVFSGALSYLLGLLMAVALPAALGMARALLLGKPLVFFSHHWAAYLFYIPAALLGLAAPFALSEGSDIVGATIGSGLVWGAVGFYTTRLRLGFSIYPFLWIAPIAMATLPVLKGSKFAKVLSLVVCTGVGTMVGVSSFVTLLEHLMDKQTLAGSLPGVLGLVLTDGIVGAAMGGGVLLATGTVLPVLAVAIKPRRRRVLPALAALSIGTGLLASGLLQPYSHDHPKRIFLQHLHDVAPSGALESRWVVATTDANPVLPLMQARHAAAAQPLEERMIRYLYPLSKLLKGVSLPAPPPNTAVIDGVPNMSLTSREALEGEWMRLHLSLDLVKPAWGKLNITGPVIKRWSFTDEVSCVPQPEAASGCMHIIRLAGNEGSDRWHFWLDVSAQVPLGIELTATYLTPSEPVTEFAAQFPSWSSVTGLTVYHRDFVFQ